MSLFQIERGKHLVMTWAGVLVVGATLGLGCIDDAGSGKAPSYGVGVGVGSGATTGVGAGQGGSSSSSGNGSGSGGSGGTIVPQMATYEVSVESATVELMSAVEVEVTIEPNEFIGQVSLSAVGLAAGVSAEFAPAMVDLDGSSTATAVLTLTTLSSVAPGEVAFVVVGASESGEKTGAASLTVEPVITLFIPQGVNDLGSVNDPYMTAYGPYPIEITAPGDLSADNPVTVKIQNADTVSHEIHADDEEIGFPHSPGPIAPGGMDQPREIVAKGTINFYLHDQGTVNTPGRIIIQ
jgi:hypothetical protein